MKYTLLSIAALISITTLVFGANLLAASPDTIKAVTSGDTSTLSASPDSAGAAGNFVYPMPTERKALLIAYSKFNNWWRFIDFFKDVIILAIIIFTGLSVRFRNWAEQIAKKKIFTILFYFLFLLALLYILDFPFDYYRNFVIEHRYGFSNQTFGGWFGETLKSTLVSFIFVVPILWILYWLINRSKKWWIYFGIGAVPFMIFIILIYPVVVAPWFNKFVPVKDKNVATEMTALAEKAGIHNPDIFEVDASKQSNKINAYFTGLFGTKRIVLYDTTIKNFTIPQLKFIMGHEIGHYVMNHIWYGLLVALIMIFIFGYLADKLLSKYIAGCSRRLGFSSLGDIASLPLLMLFGTIVGFIVQPINNGLSRHFEYQADKYGLEISGVTGDEAAVTFDKLSVFNLSDPESPALIEFWFYDHPALQKRMDNARQLYAEMHPGT